MNPNDLKTIHRRVRNAELPGYQLTYNEGSDRFCMVLYGHNGDQIESREHSWEILMEWADEELKGLCA